MPTYSFCESCKRYFEENLETHLLDCSGRTNVENQSNGTEEESTGCLEEKPKCEFCSEFFSGDEELITHQKKCKHEEIKCEKCSSLVHRWKMLEHTEKYCMRGFSKCYYCEVEITEDELESHTSICDLSPIRCYRCQLRIPRRYMTYHLSVDCVKRMVQCEYCSCEAVADILQDHFEVCTLIPVYCENKCGKELERKELQHHMVKVCPKRVVECEYCAKDLEFQLLETHYSECEKFPVSCPKVCGQSVPREEIEKHLDEACERSYAKCMYQAVSCTFEGYPVDLRKHLQEKNHFHAQMTNKKIENLSTIVENQMVIINTLERKVNELELNLKLMSTPETFLWRITGISSELREFKSNKTIFYDPKYGYNFQVWLCSKKRGIYGWIIEICFCLCSGENDKKLEWPFQKCVTFTLIDKKTYRKNDLTLLSVRGSIEEYFQKPKPDDRNPVYKDAMSVMELDNYICDNVTLIEIKVV